MYSPQFQNLGEKSDLSAGWAKPILKKAQHRWLCEHFLEWVSPKMHQIWLFGELC